MVPCERGISRGISTNEHIRICMHNYTYHFPSSIGYRFLACSEENKEKMTEVIEALCKCIRILVSIVLASPEAKMSFNGLFPSTRSKAKSNPHSINGFTVFVCLNGFTRSHK